LVKDIKKQGSIAAKREGLPFIKQEWQIIAIRNPIS